ncbi:MAG: apolipoprotein N-acyltransferase, partial [Microcystaceae cyanobacterium]
MKIKLLSCFLGGLLMASAIAPISFVYTAWFGLIPLWLGLVTQLENNNFSRLDFVQFRSALSLAIAWGIGFYGLALFWITGVHPLTWMGVPWLASLGIAIFCWLAITFWGILLVSSWAIGFILWQKFILFKIPHFPKIVRGDSLNNFKKDQLPPFQRGARGDNSFSRETRGDHFYNIIGRLIWAVTLWCILETIWSHSPLWWSSLAYTQSPNNLWFLQWGQIAGPNILTAFLVLINGILAEIILLCWNYKIKPFFMGLLLAIPASLIITIHLTGYFLDLKLLADQPKNMITVGIIQGNIPNKIKLYPEGLKKAIAAYTEGYQDLVKSGSQVVLTP